MKSIIRKSLIAAAGCVVAFAAAVTLASLGLTGLPTMLAFVAVAATTSALCSR